MDRPTVITSVDMINPSSVAVYFSDGTLAVFDVSDLLAFAPVREPYERRQPGDVPPLWAK